MVRIDRSGAKEFLPEGSLVQQAQSAIDMLKDGTGAGSDFIGWVDLPVNYDKEEFSRIQKAAKKIQSDSRALVVIGIGGSYLGARAVIELLRSPNYNMLQKSTPDIYFAGNGISSDALSEIIAMIGNRDFSVNVISKSGTTTEPAIAFRIFKEMLEKKYGKEGARERIYATTDKAKGALKTLATKEGYETFVVPDNVGGRYSVLTAVGLLPIAVSGIDIEKLMQGAAEQREEALSGGVQSVEAQYAMNRQMLSNTGKHVEILAAYEPSFRFMAEWWKQLYGESEGKDGKGLFPTATDFTTDLHSLGQFIQQGSQNHFETVINVVNPTCEIVMEEEDSDLDGLNYLAGKTVDFANKSAMNGTILAHADGGIPIIQINIDKIDEFTLGELFYTFEFACGVSGYTLGVNPFNQPGVESYKKNMFALLGKPGNEELGKKLLARING